MIFYLDTSAMVKLYIDEEHSERVKNWVRRSDIIVSSDVSYAEMASALTRAFKEGRISEGDLDSLWNAFVEDWNCYTVVEVSREVLDLAAELIFRHGLRVFDGIHLASALIVTGEGEVVFGAFDQRLIKAAEKEGLKLME
ncbi:type II toxin-antitoxin system VapC family toxin [Thermosulfurimonas sp. F29]|uniref:type II toxin-antitoxin system VapC family toxin n=1 Tax=Thermosulfurimonas sp. F29 TaxID=2867247 RepID=UPI001C8330D9|nr:type II toxin-antitoxin system VapC family toxin [Thermosulfurimonas sp. F29]MBX6422672.1 type II toxin-antitoxin system VapC family toxin [Thermosulfurimonas sp. F29]